MPDMTPLLSASTNLRHLYSLCRMERAVIVHNKHFFARNERVSADRAYPRQDFSILTYSAPHPTAIRLPHNCRAVRPAYLAAPRSLMTQCFLCTRLRGVPRVEVLVILSGNYLVFENPVYSSYIWTEIVNYSSERAFPLIYRNIKILIEATYPTKNTLHISSPYSQYGV